jgi:hypothetical protein
MRYMFHGLYIFAYQIPKKTQQIWIQDARGAIGWSLLQGLCLYQTACIDRYDAPVVTRSAVCLVGLGLPQVTGIPAFARSVKYTRIPGALRGKAEPGARSPCRRLVTIHHLFWQEA